MKVLPTTLLVMAILVCVGNGIGKRAVAEVQHVVGDDRGWTASTDVDSWNSGRVFTVGDKILFAYAGAHESILELLTVEEFLLCDLSNPIRMYSDGLDKVSLESEGVRYFASGNLESCRNGLKLPVNVHPPQNETFATITSAVTVAEEPASPAASAPGLLAAISVPLFLGLAISLFVSP